MFGNLQHLTDRGAANDFDKITCKVAKLLNGIQLLGLFSELEDRADNIEYKRLQLSRKTINYMYLE